MNILEKYQTGVVVVYSIGRSGSTVLCNYIAGKLNIPNAGEIFHMSNPDAWRDRDLALEIANKNNSDFVCKVFAGDRIKPEYFGNRKNFYNINLIREDIAKQFVSMHIANETGRWQTWSSSEFKNSANKENFKLDYNKLKKQFIDFKDYLMLKENLDQTVSHYDEVLIYEEIIDFLNNSRHRGDTIESIKPTNYDQLIEASVDLIKNFVENNEQKHIPKIMNNYYNKVIEES